MIDTKSHSKKQGDESSAFSDGVQKLGEDVGELKDNLSTLANDAVSAAAAGASDAKQSLKRTMRAARKSTNEALESAADTIAERPFKSVAIAAGVGFLVGAVIVRLRK